MQALTPETKRKARSPSLVNRQRWGTTTPERMTSVLRAQEVGDVGEWADLASYMIRFDPHLRSLYQTRISSVAGASFRIDSAKPGDPLADKAAELCRDMLDRVRDFERKLALLLHGNFIGWSLLEHNWRVERDGMWLSIPLWLNPRDSKFDRDCRLMHKGEDDRYFYIDDHPGRFIVHMPQQVADTPNVTGDLTAIAWEWLFKRWFRKFQLRGTEAFANPFIYGTVPQNATEAIRETLLENISKLSADQVAVFEEGTGISIAEIGKTAGEDFLIAIDGLNAEMTKGILGSTLNVEIGASGGNRAAAESQADTTILPRMISDAKRLAGTIERDWLAPFLRHNALLTGGMVAPTPRFVFELIAEEPPNVDELAVSSGVVTKDELRTSRGLEAWGPERGGDDVITADTGQPIFGYHLQGAIVSRDDVRKQLGLAPIGGSLGGELLDIGGEPTAPAFSSGGTSADAPLASPPSMNPTPSLSAKAKTSPTSSRLSLTPIEAALLGKSVGRAKRPSARRSSPSKR